MLFGKHRPWISVLNLSHWTRTVILKGKEREYHPSGKHALENKIGSTFLQTNNQRIKLYLRSYSMSSRIFIM